MAITTGSRPVRGPRAVDTNRWLVLALVGIAQFMVVLDATIVNVALPSIQRGLGFSSDNLQWVINAYSLTFGGLLLLGGRAADLLGRRRLFMAGIAVFSVASLLNGLATSPGVLVAGRALQGIGGALVSPAALSILTTTFAEGGERTKAMGVWSAISAGGGAVGLLLGGVLTDLLSWQWVFFVNVPVGIGALLLSARFVPESRSAGLGRSVDVWGGLSVTAGLVVLVYAIVDVRSAGWLGTQTLGLAALATVLLGEFVVIEMRHRHPLIRLGIFRSRSLSGADAAMLVVAAGLFSTFFFATLYVQNVLGYSPLRAGLAFLPLTAGIVVGAGLAQQLIRRIGVRGVAMVGLSLAGLGLLYLSRIPVEGSYLANLLPGLLAMAVGMGLTFVSVMLIATTGVDASDAGLASGLLTTAQQVGGALGLAVLSTVASNHTSSTLSGLGHRATQPEVTSALVGGFGLAFLLAAVLMLSGMVTMAAVVRRRHVAAVEEASTIPVPVAA